MDQEKILFIAEGKIETFYRKEKKNQMNTVMKEKASKTLEKT
jgi:hypothetical protein